MFARAVLTAASARDILVTWERELKDAAELPGGCSGVGAIIERIRAHSGPGRWRLPVAQAPVRPENFSPTFMRRGSGEEHL